MALLSKPLQELELEDQSIEAPRLTRWVRALMLAFVEGLSLGVAIGFWRAAPHLQQYVSNNRDVGGTRQVLIASGFVGSLLVPFLLLLSCALPHALGKRLKVFEVRAKVLSPLAAVGFIPLVFQPLLWKDKTLGFLITTAVFGVVVTLCSRSFVHSLRSANWGSIREVWRSVKWPFNQRLVTALSFLLVLVATVYSISHALSASKTVPAGAVTEWDIAQRFNDYGSPILWLGRLGSISLGHLGAAGLLNSLWVRMGARAESLWALRVVAVAWPALPLFLWARKAGGTVAAVLLALTYLSLPPQALLSLGEPFPVSTALGWLFLSACLFEYERFVWSAIVAVCAIALNEQIAIWYVGIGLYWFSRPKGAILGASLVALAASYFAYVTFIRLPDLGVLIYAPAPVMSTVARAMRVMAQHTSAQPEFISIFNFPRMLVEWLDHQDLEFWLLLFTSLGLLPLKNRLWFLLLLPGALLLSFGSMKANWHSAAFTHMVALALVSCVVTLRRLRYELHHDLQSQRTSVVAGWLATVTPCVIMFGSLWFTPPPP